MTDRQLATVLAALRHRQQYVEQDSGFDTVRYGHYFDDHQPLDFTRSTARANN